MMAEMFFLKKKKIKVGILPTKPPVARNLSYGDFFRLQENILKSIQKVPHIFLLN